MVHRRIGPDGDIGAGEAADPGDQLPSIDLELVGHVGELAPEQPRPATALDGLSDAERRVYEALPGRGVATVDEIAVAAALQPAHILAPLAMLEIAGLAERHDGRWRIVRKRSPPL